MIRLNKLYINNQDYTDYAVWTLQGQDTLDESLDMQYIELKATPFENPLKPFSDVLIELQDNKNTISKKMFIESDTVTEVISNKSYNHNLLFIEETKWLERLFVEKTVRQPLIHDYTNINPDIVVVFNRKIEHENDEGENGQKVNTISFVKSVINVGNSVTLLNAIDFMDEIHQAFGFDRLNISTGTPLNGTFNIYKNGKLIQTSSVVWNDVTQGRPNWTFDFKPDEEGAYSCVITVTGAKRLSSGTTKYVTDTARFDLSAIFQAKKKDDYTIRDVVNQLLATCVTIRESEKPLFELAEIGDYDGYSKDYKRQIEKILNATSPEFTFSKMSLFEALKTIGDYAHFIPRLKNKKIYFDLLGQMEQADTESLGEYYSNVSAQTSNDFCNALDSQVNNLTNMDDREQGSVSTPDNIGYRTLRTESGNVQITDGNIIIPTEDNIEDIVKLEIGYLSDGTYVGDITPFVYEEDEYKTLSSYSNAVNTSKMYAIKYKQGSKNITELSFQRQNPDSQALESIAIINIVFKAIDKPASAWNSLLNIENVFKLQYRLTYIPSTSARVTQHKAITEDITNKPLYIAYNQSASKVSSNAYGENLKGTIAKLGNIEKTKMYILPTFDLIPRCGTLFDKDYYISVVKYEVYPNFIKCELGLSKNYNNKSAYVEINSQLEFFEYNRNITIDRYIVYEDFCEVGYNSSADKKALITDAGIDKFANSFVDGYTSTPVSCVKAQGYDYLNNNLTEVVLPVISLGIGNSVLLSYHYEDTISVGNIAYDSDRGRFQDYVKYTDIYGEVDTLKLGFGISTDTPRNYEEAVTRGDTIPLTVNFGNMETYFETGDDKIVLKKGVGENPHITYQMHFVSNNPNLIIGSGLTRKSTFTTSEVHNYKMYLLPKPINKFETKIDLTNAILCDSISISKDYDNKKIKIKNITNNKVGTYASWAIVQTHNNTNDLIIGENKTITGGEVIEMPTFNFKRRLK